MNHLFQWPPQPSTLIALAVLGGGIAWYFTGSAELAGLVGAGIAGLLPDNSGAGNQVTQILAKLEQLVPPRKLALFLVASIGAVMMLNACTNLPANGLQLTAPPPTSVCQTIAKAQSNATVSQQLAAIDPTSALGVVWAQAKSGCSGATPAAGVDATWTQSVWQMVLNLLPIVLPKLVPLIAAAV